MTAQPPLDDEEYRRWRQEANRALAGATLQAGGGLHNWACFAAEQATQLAVKGLLHGLGSGPRGCDLTELADLLASAGVVVPSEAMDRFRRLGRHYIPARYPDAHPSGPPGTHYGEADASEAIADAEHILAFVDEAWRTSTGEIVAGREAERRRLIELARTYLEGLSRRLSVRAAAVVGSVARGDFNVWSDVDVVVVAEALPERAPDRASILGADAPPGVQPVGFRPGEFEAAWRKGNPLAREATRAGIALCGEDFLTAGREPVED